MTDEEWEPEKASGPSKFEVKDGSCGSEVSALNCGTVQSQIK